MNHQPFETWIFDQDTLPPADRRALQEHITTCEPCQRTQQKWQAVNRELRAKPSVAPSAGFTQRWQASLTERRAREQQTQAWRAFLGLFTGAVVILLAILYYIVTLSSPAEWLAGFIQSVANAAGLVNSTIVLVRIWFASTPLALNLTLWMYISVSFCLLSLVWVAALWRTLKIGVYNQ